MSTFWRQIFKYKWVLITFWSKDKDLENIEKILIMCYGNPSHPFDHTPQNLWFFLEKNFLLVFFDYIWTFGSDWVCTFNNSIESTLNVLEFLTLWKYKNERENKEISWKNAEKILIWASYGWSVCLCAWAISNNIRKIISLSPVIDWKNFDKKNLHNTYNFLKNIYNNFWRCSEESLENFKNWNIQLSPLDYIKELDTKEILFIQDKKDYQINFSDVENFYKNLNPKNKKLYFEDKNRHILLHHLSEKDILENVLDFLR